MAAYELASGCAASPHMPWAHHTGSATWRRHSIRTAQKTSRTGRERFKVCESRVADNAPLRETRARGRRRRRAGPRRLSAQERHSDHTLALLRRLAPRSRGSRRPWRRCLMVCRRVASSSETQLRGRSGCGTAPPIRFPFFRSQSMRPGCSAC